MGTSREPSIDAGHIDPLSTSTGGKKYSCIPAIVERFY